MLGAVTGGVGTAVARAGRLVNDVAGRLGIPGPRARVVVAVLVVMGMLGPLLPVLIVGLMLGGASSIDASYRARLRDPVAINATRELVTTYWDASRAVGGRVPWSILFAVGEVATEHGRRSPYDTIDRRPGGWGAPESPAGAGTAPSTTTTPPPESGDPVQPPLTVVVWRSGDRWLLGDDPAGRRDRLAESALAGTGYQPGAMLEFDDPGALADFLGTTESDRVLIIGPADLSGDQAAAVAGALTGRDPRPKVMWLHPTGDGPPSVRTDQLAPVVLQAADTANIGHRTLAGLITGALGTVDGFDPDGAPPPVPERVSAFPVADPPIGGEDTPAVGPLLLDRAALAALGESVGDPQRLDDSALVLARNLAELAAEVAAEEGLSGSDPTRWDPDVADRVWIRVLERSITVDPALARAVRADGCPTPDAAQPADVLIQVIWGCRLAAVNPVVVTALDPDGKVRAVHSGESARRLILAEALQVAWVWSQHGAFPCDPADPDPARSRSVFPLPWWPGDSDACDPVANITAAAELVIPDLTRGQPTLDTDTGRLTVDGEPVDGREVFAAGWRHMLAVFGGDPERVVSTGTRLDWLTGTTRECRYQLARALERAVRALPDGDGWPDEVLVGALETVTGDRGLRDECGLGDPDPLRDRLRTWPLVISALERALSPDGPADGGPPSDTEGYTDEGSDGDATGPGDGHGTGDTGAGSGTSADPTVPVVDAGIARMLMDRLAGDHQAAVAEAGVGGVMVERFNLSITPVARPTGTRIIPSLWDTGGGTKTPGWATRVLQRAVQVGALTRRDTRWSDGGGLDLSGLPASGRMLTIAIDKDWPVLPTRDSGPLVPAGCGAGPDALVRVEFKARWDLLCRDATLAGVAPPVPVGGWRSQAEQEALYADKPGLAAPPGRSNHQRGTAVDVNTVLGAAFIDWTHQVVGCLDTSTLTYKAYPHALDRFTYAAAGGPGMPIPGTEFAGETQYTCSGTWVPIKRIQTYGLIYGVCRDSDKPHLPARIACVGGNREEWHVDLGVPLEGVTGFTAGVYNLSADCDSTPTVDVSSLTAARTTIPQAVWTIFYCEALTRGLDLQPPDPAYGHLFANRAEQVATEAVLVGFCESQFVPAVVSWVPGATNTERTYKGVFQMHGAHLANHPPDPRWQPIGVPGGVPWQFDPIVNIATAARLYFDGAGRPPWDGWGPWAVVNTELTDAGTSQPQVGLPVLPRFAATRGPFAGRSYPWGIPDWARDPFRWRIPDNQGCVTAPKTGEPAPWAPAVPLGT